MNPAVYADQNENWHKEERKKSVLLTSEKDLLQKYEKASKAKVNGEIKAFQKKMSRVQARSEKTQKEFLEALDGLSPGLSGKLQSRLKILSKLKVSHSEKLAIAEKEFAPYQRYFLKAANQSSDSYEQLRGILQKFFPASKVTDLWQAIFQSSDYRGGEIVDDIFFSPSFTDSISEVNGSYSGVFTGDVDVNQYTGQLSGEYTTAYLGTVAVKGGMKEIFNVPAGTTRVKVSATIHSNYDLGGVAIGGLGAVEATSFLHVYGDNTFKCEKSQQVAYLINAVINFQLIDGDTTHTLTCTFTPHELGGDYVLAGGIKGASFAALNGWSIGSYFGEVEQMKVEFVED